MAKKPTTTDAGAETAGTALAELTPDQRAEKALSFADTRAQLQKLAGESTSLTRVDTEDNFAAAKAAKAKLQSTRVAIEKTGKAARDDANKFQKAVIAKERDLVNLIAPEEQRLSQLIATEQLRRDEAERVAREAEQRRAEQIRQAFAELRALPERAAAADLAGIDQLIATAQAVVDDQSGFPEDLRPAARYEAQVAVAACKAARDRRVQADRDAEELAEFRRQKADQEARAQANAAEAHRAAGVVAANAKAPEDDDLPPGHAPAPVAIPDSVTVPVRQVLPLLQASKAALALLRRKGLGSNIETVELAQAIEGADQ